MSESQEPKIRAKDELKPTGMNPNLESQKRTNENSVPHGAAMKDWKYLEM